MNENKLRKFNHHPSGMIESRLGDYYYDTEVDELLRQQQATIKRLTEQRDRLLRDLKYLNSEIGSISVKALIAEIEAENE